MIRSAASYQQGTATIMFILMVPVLFGFFALGIEGSRYIQTRIQLDDAAEVASLALSARGSSDQTANEALAKAYIEALVPDAKNILITVTRRECKDISGCGTPGIHDSRGFHFYEYRVSATTTHDSWLPWWNSSGLGFAPEVSLGTAAVSRKFQGTAIDVVFVADFSWSMSQKWGSENKIVRLKEIVKDIASEVISYSASWQDKNKIALVPFSNRTYDKNSSGQFCTLIQYGKSAADTVSNLFIEKQCSNPKNSQDFHTVALTDSDTQLATQLTAMKTKSFFSCVWRGGGGCTASFEGIIRGAQIASKGQNPYRLIVVLSDGEDMPNSETTKHTQLLSHNYCDKIRAELNKQTTTSGYNVSNSRKLDSNWHIFS